MTTFPNYNFPPKWARSPLTFQAEHSAAVPWRGRALRPAVGCSARHSCLPAHLLRVHCQRAGQPASACYYSKPLPNPQLSGLRCGRLPIAPRLFHTLESAQDHPERGREPGVSGHCSHGPVQSSTRASPFVCAYLSAFSIAADVALHAIKTTQKRNHSIQFNRLLLMMTYDSLTSLFLFCSHASFYYCDMEQPIS